MRRSPEFITSWNERLTAIARRRKRAGCGKRRRSSSKKSEIRQRGRIGRIGAAAIRQGHSRRFHGSGTNRQNGLLPETPTIWTESGVRQFRAVALCEYV